MLGIYNTAGNTVIQKTLRPHATSPVSISAVDANTYSVLTLPQMLQCLMNINRFNPHNQPYEFGTIVSPIIQMSKLMHREVN